MYKVIIVLFAVVVLAMAGCSQAGAGAGALPTETPGTEGTAPSQGNATGETAQFIDALRAQGATVDSAGEVAQPFLPVTGQLLTVNGADVEVFEVQDEATRQQLSSAISQTGSAGANIPEFVDQVTFWAKGRLIVLFVGQDQALSDSITKVMGDAIAQIQPQAQVQIPQAAQEAVQAAQQQLSQVLGIAADQLQIVTVEHVDWPNSCLGLGQPGETCAQVITSGWRVVFQAGGQQIEVRTDGTGQVVRVRETILRATPTP
jgi:hypothetical protein